eukprot:COSAG05_NODE_19113_length_297_cov_0.964646_1_plen_88_part_10
MAFSTANAHLFEASGGQDWPDGGGTALTLPNSDLNPLFGAAADATEEAIVNALVAATDMTGYKGRFQPRLPHTELRSILKKYGRLSE